LRGSTLDFSLITKHRDHSRNVNARIEIVRAATTEPRHRHTKSANRPVSLNR
jgi:hypothetical protein